MSALDDFLQADFAREQREAAEREARLKALQDPFKRKRTEPGRALPYHGFVSSKRPSVSGERHA